VDFFGTSGFVFLVRFLSFQNFENGVGTRMPTFGGSVSFNFSIFLLIIEFLVIQGVFFEFGFQVFKIQKMDLE